MSLSLVSVDGTEPVSLSEAKAQLRVDLSDEDTRIGDLISSARGFFEKTTGRQVVQATYTLTLDGFPRSRHEPIRLPRPPLQSITSIKYIDGDGVEQTWTASEYSVDAFTGSMSQMGKVYPTADNTWPVTRAVPGAVTITFVAGYAAADVPDGIKGSLLLLIEDLYDSDNRPSHRFVNRYRLPAYA